MLATIAVVAMFSRVIVSSIIHTDLNTIGPEGVMKDNQEIAANEDSAELSYAIMGDMGSSGTKSIPYHTIS